MPDIVPWIRSYFAAEHEAHVAVLRHARDAKAKLLAARKFYGPGCGPFDISPTDEPDPDRAAKARERRLFAVRYFDGHAQAIASDLYELAPVVSMFAAFFIKRRSIIARANACLACNASGSYRGKTCPECKGAGWEMRPRTAGAGLLAGAPTHVDKLEPPTSPGSRATWDAW